MNYLYCSCCDRPHIVLALVQNICNGTILHILHHILRPYHLVRTFLYMLCIHTVVATGALFQCLYLFSELPHVPSITYLVM